MRSVLLMLTNEPVSDLFGYVHERSSFAVLGTGVAPFSEGTAALTCEKQYHTFTSGSTSTKGYLQFHSGT